MAIPTQEPSALAPSPAVAPPPGSPRFPLLDSLRGLAVLAVLTFHVVTISGALVHRWVADVTPVLATQGLMLFFSISGFLLYRPFVAARADGRRRPSLTRYGRRRLLRIVPGYWTALTVLAIFPGIAGVFSGEWWRYYFFLQGFASRTVVSGIPPAWSLSVEVSFYLLLPVWVVGVARLGSRTHWWRAELGALTAVGLGGVIIQVLASRLQVSSLVVDSVAGESVWLAIGMALAVLSVAVEREPRRWRAVRLLGAHPDLSWMGAIVCVLVAVEVLRPGGPFGTAATVVSPQPLGRTLSALVCNAGCCVLAMSPALFGDSRGGLARGLLGRRPLLQLGLISYGVYLYHLTLAELIGERSAPGQFRAGGIGLAMHSLHLRTILLWIATVAASVIAASISYRIVELPMLRLKESPRRRRRAV